MKLLGLFPSAEDRAAARAKREQQRAAHKQWEAKHQQRMYAAAGASSVTLRCHQDTWHRISNLMHSRADWHAPESDSIKRLAGQMVEVRISGPNLGALLFKASQTARFEPYPAHRAFADRLYDAFAQVADSIDPAAPGKPLPPVVLDDQAAAAPKESPH